MGICLPGGNEYSIFLEIDQSRKLNYGQNIGKPAEVGQYAANSWGFFDMHGVSEWTAD